MIPIYAPDVRVFLHKTIMRQTTNGKDAVSERFKGAAARQVIDLEPFLGEGATVRTTKSLAAPAGGFSITLVDRPDSPNGAGFESLYALVEPMDMIEIIARHGAPTTASRAPTLMRGFVSEIQREESAGGGGQPARYVTIVGHDYGKLWQIIQVSYLPNYLIGQAYISGFPLFEQFGISNNILSAKEFATEVLAKVINPYLGRLIPENGTLPSVIQADISVAPASVSPGIQTHQGTIFDLMRYYGDVGPWNELFMEDRDDGVFMVYRANPYLKTDGSGAKIQPEAPDPVYVDIPSTDIVSINSSRSDADVANFYWVANQRFNLVVEAYRQQWAIAVNSDTVVLADYLNSAVRLYGNRILTLETQQGGAPMGTHDPGRPAADVYQLGSEAVTFMDRRRQIVVDSNKDNIVLERGSMRVRGNEEIKVGRYLRIKRGNVTWVAYVVQVDHSFSPFQPFITSVTYERGTGFIERIKSPAQAPYFEDQAP